MEKAFRASLRDCFKRARRDTAIVRSVPEVIGTVLTAMVAFEGAKLAHIAEDWPGLLLAAASGITALAVVTFGRFYSILGGRHTVSPSMRFSGSNVTMPNCERGSSTRRRGRLCGSNSPCYSKRAKVSNDKRKQVDRYGWQTPTILSPGCTKRGLI
jgi:hypothetical protein